MIAKIARAADYYEKRQLPWRILVLGGSQGARFINQLMMDFVSVCDDRREFLLWHQTGVADYEKVKTAYARYENFPHRVAPFIDKIEEAYTWADCVIARAGALTVSEIAAVGLPAIFIPFPAAVDDHQFCNAQFLAAQGASVIFREADVTVKKFSDCLKHQFFSQEKLKQKAAGAQRAAMPDALLQIIKYVATLKTAK